MIPKMLTTAIRSVILKMKNTNEIKRIEEKFEVQTYLDRLKYAIQSGNGKIHFQKSRVVDNKRDGRYTNRYTLGKLFPDEDEVTALKRELVNLEVRDYIETVKDLKFPERTEMRVFGKFYFSDEVYIKIRVELVSLSCGVGDSYIFVMSFHFAERSFKDSDFPFKK